MNTEWILPPASVFKNCPTHVIQWRYPASSVAILLSLDQITWRWRWLRRPTTAPNQKSKRLEIDAMTTTIHENETRDARATHPRSICSAGHHVGAKGSSTTVDLLCLWHVGRLRAGNLVVRFCFVFRMYEITTWKKRKTTPQTQRSKTKNRSHHHANNATLKQHSVIINHNKQHKGNQSKQKDACESKPSWIKRRIFVLPDCWCVNPAKQAITRKIKTMWR